MVLSVGAVAGLAVFLFTSTWSKEAFAEPETCTPPLPEPGPARPWEAQVAVSTYSSVNTRNGNVFTAIPIVSWSGIGPDMNMMLYHNSANVPDPASSYAGYSIADVVGFDLGPGWSISYSDHLLLDQLPNITLVRANGTRDKFTWNSAQQIWYPSAEHDVLTEVADTSEPTWRVTHKDQSYHEFKDDRGDGIGRLQRIRDAVGNDTTVFHGDPHLESVTAAGRGLALLVDNNFLSPTFGFLLEILDPRDESGAPDSGDITNRSWTFEYESGSGRLNTFTAPRGKPIHLTYDSDGRIETISERHEHLADESTPPHLDLHLHRWAADRGR